MKIDIMKNYNFNSYLSSFPDYVADYFSFLISKKRLSDQSIQKYFYDLRLFFDYIIRTNSKVSDYKGVSLSLLNHISTNDLELYKAFLCRYEKNGKVVCNSPAGIRRKLFVIRSFYDYLIIQNLINNNPTIDLVIERPAATPPHKLKNKDIASIMINVSSGNGLTDSKLNYSTRTTLRDTSIIQLLLFTDLRVSELVNLDISDIDFNRDCLHVATRSGKAAYVDLNSEVITTLSDYIDNERFSTDDGNFALFLSSRRNENSRLGIRAVEKLVKKYGETIGKTVTPTTLRYCNFEE